MQGFANHGILRDVLTQLKQTGWSQGKQLNPTGESFLMEKKLPGIAPNTPRVSDAIVTLIQSEVLCDFDLHNHSFLYDNFPSVQLPSDDTTVTAAGLLTPAAGESVINEDEESSCDDHQEPTEAQKRELLKIHRGIGHPTSSDFGRALRHAGVRRHLVRWAVKDMRCLVCESRVKPAAKRPGALPRCLKFNQVVGMDLVEFPDHGVNKVLANIICWGTG